MQREAKGNIRFNELECLGGAWIGEEESFVSIKLGTIACSSLAISSSTPSTHPLYMFSAAFLVQALLASAVLAIPSSKERFAARRARRSTGETHHSKPINRISSEVSPATSHTEFSENWAGAILIASTVSQPFKDFSDRILTDWNASQATYQSVTGTFTIPTLNTTGGSCEQCASAWVGIDGDTCNTTILQTGVDFCVNGNEVSFEREQLESLSKQNK